MLACTVLHSVRRPGLLQMFFILVSAIRTPAVHRLASSHLTACARLKGFMVWSRGRVVEQGQGFHDLCASRAHPLTPSNCAHPLNLHTCCASVPCRFVNDFWETSKKMLSDMSFLESLKTYDKVRRTGPVIRQPCSPVSVAAGQLGCNSRRAVWLPLGT